jgi:hypothetical protein
MKVVLIIGMALVLSSCFAAGRKVTHEQVSELIPGKTTYQEVIARLGKPTNSTFRSDGTRSIFYSYTQTQMKATNYIPYLNLFTRGSESESSSTHLHFDRNGILTTFSSDTGEISNDSGILGGQRQ